MIIEAKDVKFFEITKIEDSNLNKVRITGLVFHSSMAVKKIDLIFDKNVAVIRVIITPTHAGLSGRFSIDVPIDSGVNKILFGQELIQIWSSDY